MQEVKSLIELAKHKNKIDLKRGEERFMDPNWLLDRIIDEIEEVREELKPNNVACLEDELSDILWGWMVLIEKLKQSKYVSSHEDILKRTLKKYEERILPLKGDESDHAIWKEVKNRQKEALAIESLNASSNKH